MDKAKLLELAVIESALAGRFFPDLKQGTLLENSPDWFLWRRYQECLFRAAALRALAAKEPLT